MRTKKDDFLKQLRETFKVEAAEHVQAIVTGLLVLERTPAPHAQRETVETVFRCSEPSGWITSVVAMYRGGMPSANATAEGFLKLSSSSKNSSSCLDSFITSM